MADPVCTLAEFVDNAACYKNLNSHERQATEVYLKALQLAALGGTDYTAQLDSDGTLILAVACLKTLSNLEVELAHLVINANNATEAGATVPSDIQDVAAAIACLKNFDAPTLARMNLLLTCLLGVHAAYPQ